MKKRNAAQLFFSIVIILIFYTARYYIAQHPEPQKAQVATTSSITQTVQGVQTSQCHIRGVLPDPACTPGSIDPAVTQNNIQQTICTKGYTKTVRPPASYTNVLKREQIAEYGYVDKNLKDYEEDHLISLELGGSPTDPKNLWPEPDDSPNPKDEVENRCHEKVCNGELLLADAQKQIARDWTIACQ